MSDDEYVRDGFPLAFVDSQLLMFPVSNRQSSTASPYRRYPDDSEGCVLFGTLFL